MNGFVKGGGGKGVLGPFADATALNREYHFRMLPERGYPEWSNLFTVMDALGFRFAVGHKAKKTRKRSA